MTSHPDSGGPKKFLYTGPKKGNDGDSDDFSWNFISARGQEPITGGAKKFMYKGPKKGSDDDTDDFSWNFNSARGQEPKTGNISPSKFDLDGVWSIRSNVNIGGPPKPPKADLSFNTNKSYYSRHNEGKDKDEFSASHEIASANIGNADSTGIKMRNTESQSHRQFSYASGGDAQEPSNVHGAPLQISNTSTPLVPQTSNNQFLSVNNGKVTSDTKCNAFRGRSSPDDNTERNSSGNFVRNKNAFPSSNVSSSHSLTQAHRNNMFHSNSDKGNTRNSLFTGKNNNTNWNNKSSLDGSSSDRQNQPFW